MTNAELIATLRGENYFVTLLHDAADALEADEKRIAELERILKAVQENSGINFRLWQEAEAQIPKEGVWQGIIIDGQYWAITCSNCHQVGFNAKTPYCPNCGAKMKNVTDCHTLNER